MSAQKEGEKRTDEALKRLGERQGEHVRLGERMAKADGGNVFMMDFLAVAVLNRSLRLVKGFCDQIKTNFMCAAPLVRLQLDNLLRLRAAHEVGNLNNFVKAIMQGTPIKKLKDRKGQPMTDARLLELASIEYPQLKDIYERGCSYIHLCEVHIAHAVQGAGPMQATLSVSLEDHEITDEHRLNALDVMTYVTDLVLSQVEGWVQTKANPEFVRNPMKRAEWLLERGHVTKAKEWLRMVIKGHHDPSIVANAQAKLASIS
jgi:hypothetical protein